MTIESDEDSATDALTTWLSPFVSGLVGFAVAYWIWPWLGPQILTPCPQWTTLGIGLYTVWHAFKGVGHWLKTQETKRLKRRLSVLEMALKIGLRVSRRND